MHRTTMTLPILVCAAIATALGCANGEREFDSEGAMNNGPTPEIERVKERIVTFGTVTTVFALPEQKEEWGKGELTGVGFQPDPRSDDASIMPTKPLFLPAKLGDETINAINQRLQPGQRIWVQAQNLGDVYAASAIETPGYSELKAIGSSASTGDVGVEIIDVAAWVNRMPMATNNRHLVINLKATNQSTQPREIKFRRAFHSFEPTHEGAPMKVALSFIDPETGMPGSARAQKIAANGTAEIALRAIDAYPEGHEDETMYMLVILEIDGRVLALRNHGTIQVVH